MMTIKPGICSIVCQKYNKQNIVEFFREIKFKSVLVEDESKEDAAKIKIKLHPMAGLRVHPEPAGVFDEENYQQGFRTQNTFAIMEDALAVARKEYRADSERMKHMIRGESTANCHDCQIDKDEEVLQ